MESVGEGAQQPQFHEMLICVPNDHARKESSVAHVSKNGVIRINSYYYFFFVIKRGNDTYKKKTVICFENQFDGIIWNHTQNSL